MRVGIDISQIAYEGTGVGNYVRNLVSQLLVHDAYNSYILFGASLRQRNKFYTYYKSLLCDKSRVKLVTVPIPPTILDILWNVFHIVPVEWFVGPCDVFWSSDWTQPPLSTAKGITTIHDLSVFKFPESFTRKIITVQKRRLMRAKHECTAFLCDSKATQADLVSILRIDKSKTRVVYPGFTLPL